MKIYFFTFVLIVFAMALFTIGLLSVSGIIKPGDLSPVLIRLNLPSISIIIGGLLAHSGVTFPSSRLSAAMLKIFSYFSHSKNNYKTLKDDIDNLIIWQSELRDNRLGKAFELSEYYNNKFEGYFFSLVATNYSMEDIRKLGEAKIHTNYQKTLQISNVFFVMGNASPAYGMLGTLIGLIVMLQNYQDPLQLGAGLSIALMTTLYGLFFAQFIFYPMSRKISHAAESDLLREQILMEGILMIMAARPSLYIRDYLMALLK